MTLKNLYENVKREDTKSISWYIGAYLVWLLIMAAYIVIVWLGWNYLAKIFGLIKLTYIQTTIITLWLNFIRHIFSSKGAK
jgi:hypothetical protein